MGDVPSPPLSLSLSIYIYIYIYKPIFFICNLSNEVFSVFLFRTTLNLALSSYRIRTPTIIFAYLCNEVTVLKFGSQTVTAFIFAVSFFPESFSGKFLDYLKKYFGWFLDFYSISTFCYLMPNSVIFYQAII